MSYDLKLEVIEFGAWATSEVTKITIQSHCQLLYTDFIDSEQQW